jgi:hypothetical protein
VGFRFVLHPLKKNLFASAENRITFTRLSSPYPCHHTNTTLYSVSYFIQALHGSYLSGTRSVRFNIVDKTRVMIAYEAG